MRCLIYTRVSTTTHDQTTENQVAQLKEYAHRQNWEIVEIIEEYCSGGKSAEERTGLKKYSPWHGKRNLMYFSSGASTD